MRFDELNLGDAVLDGLEAMNFQEITLECLVFRVYYYTYLMSDINAFYFFVP